MGGGQNVQGITMMPNKQGRVFCLWVKFLAIEVENQYQPQIQNKQTPKNIRLSKKAFVAVSYDPNIVDDGKVKSISIDKLQEEARKLGLGFQDPSQIDH